MQNVEIKAKVHDWDKQFNLAQALADMGPEILHQEDIFFMSPKGRLKLRIFNEDQAELIAYSRPDQRAPKTSTYEIYPTDYPFALQEVISSALPIQGKVIKTRVLFLVGQTRVHFDRVRDLGQFIELEVVMRPGQPQVMGENIARQLMKQLEIHPADCVEASYIDLLKAGQP